MTAKVCAQCGAPPASRRIYCAKCRDPEMCMHMGCSRPRYGKRVYCQLHYYEHRKFSGRRKAVCTGGCGRFTVLGECKACKRLRAKKQCAGPCGEVKLSVSFNVRKASPDGKADICKSCAKPKRVRRSEKPIPEETVSGYHLRQPISRQTQPCPERNHELRCRTNRPK